MKEAHIFDVFTTLAANSADPAYNPFNAVLLEIYYLLLRGVKPQQLILDPDKVLLVLHSLALVLLLISSPHQQSSERLKSLLDVEARSKQHEQRQRASRHSRFGTTVTIKSVSIIVHSKIKITTFNSSLMTISRGMISSLFTNKRGSQLMHPV